MVSHDASMAVVAVLGLAIAVAAFNEAHASYLESEFVPFQSTVYNLRGAAINEATGKIYVVASEFPSGFVLVLNATTLEQMAVIPTEIPYPSDIAVDETANVAYLSYECHCPEAATISVINGTSDEIVGSIDAKDYPAIRLAVNPFTDKIYAITNTTFLSMIDVGTGNVSKMRIDDKTIEDVANSGIGTYDVELTPIPSTTFVLDGDKKSVIAIRNDGIENKVLYNVTVHSVPDERAIDNRLVSMAVNPATNMVYVVNEAIYPPPAPNAGVSISVGYVVAINGTSGKILSENVTQMHSFELAVDERRNVIYGTSGSNGLVAINGSDNKVIGEYPYNATESIYARKIIVSEETNALYLVAPSGIVKIDSPVPEDKELTEDERQKLLSKLDEAQDALGSKLPAYDELPASAWAVDDQELVLDVLIDERVATLPKQAYVDKLKELLGDDIPVKVAFGHYAPVEAGNQSLLQKIEDAHQLLTEMMSNRTIREKGIPVFLSDADEQNMVLVVGIDDREATLPLAAYEDKLKKILGDVPMRISFGHASLD